MTTTTKKKNAKAMTVADYLNHQIEICGKTQREISLEIGYDKPNIITMFKQGLTKLPITKVEKMATALGVDPKYLLRLVLNEYMPDTLPVIEKFMGYAITDNEKLIIDKIRNLSKNSDPRYTSASQAALKAFVKTL